ncbi:hypothetical protein Tchar_01384 [Tepidimonas charontis]|uniref:Uncharacterized protein n=2 Tax=Tepidimonas charontis TaxID=2267262 RepID=A0A554XF47_9BURK|nr:hypothetical protein Tchar_01384 [Tepidimonas charontis]
MPITRLQHGISQAIARHVLTHKTEPSGGWTLDGLIRTVAGGDIRGQALWDKRREARADADGLAAAGVLLEDDRVRRGKPRPDDMEQRPDDMEQRPDDMEQRPGAWSKGPGPADT